MIIERFSSAAAVARAAAQEIAEALEREPALVLGLPTGRTSIGIYQELVRRHEQSGLDFSQAFTVNLDEFAGLSGSDRRSFRSFMDAHLFRHVNLQADHVHFLDGRARDLAAECLRFDRQIADLGGIGLQILGVGANGHIGFNEPSKNLHARTHVATLTMETRRANAARFGGKAALVPRTALSIGMATILGARSILLVATGAEKARAVEALLSGRVTTARPVSFLQLHPDVRVMVDRGAASRLR